MQDHCSEFSKKSNKVEIMELFSSPSFRKIVHRGSMIEVIIPEIVLLCLIVVLYIVVHRHGSLIEMNMAKVQEHFLQLLKEISF